MMGLGPLNKARQTRHSLGLVYVELSTGMLAAMPLRTYVKYIHFGLRTNYTLVDLRVHRMVYLSRVSK